MNPLNNADKAQIRNLVLAMWLFENRTKHIGDYGRSLEQLVEAIDEAIFDKEEKYDAGRGRR